MLLIQTAFPPVTPLLEASGNALNKSYDYHWHIFYSMNQFFRTMTRV